MARVSLGALEVTGSSKQGIFLHGEAFSAPSVWAVNVRLGAMRQLFKIK